MSKKILITLAIIVIITLVAVGGYLLLKNPNVPITTTLSNILPFGSGDDAQIPTNTDDDQLTIDTGEGLETGDQNIDKLGVPTTTLFRVSNTPVAGFVILNLNASTTVTRFVDRATGHIYDVNLTTLEKTKVTNQTLPKIYEAYFKADGKAVVMRSLKNDSDVVENFSIILTQPSTQSTSTDSLYTTTSTPIRGDVGAFSVGPDNVLVYNLRDAATIVSSTFNGSGIKTLFNSPFTDWRLVATSNNLIVYTKASASVSGYAYTLKYSGGELTKILGPLNGLTAIPNTPGNRVLYSHVKNNETRLFVKNLTAKTLSEIPIATLAEKCVWSKIKTAMVFCASPSDEIGPNEPDNWYRGLTTFSDRIWSFDTDTQITKILIEPAVVLDIDIDAISPMLSPKEDYFVFINNSDLSLWALKLGQL